MGDGENSAIHAKASNTNNNEDHDWQIVKTNKRRHEESPKPKNFKRIALNDRPTTSNNAYNLLQNDNDDGEEFHDTEENSEPKPPPIIIPDVGDVKKMLEDISKVIMPQEYTYKSLKNGHIRLMTKSSNAYRTVVKHLDSQKKMFHTYQLKQERSYRVVVKNLHYTTPINDIKSAIENEGHKVRNIMNLKSRISKQPMSIFFVDLEPKSNNTDIYNIKHILNAGVKIEPPIKSKDLPQCHKCQQLGHTRTYCRYPDKCVKCGLGHPSKNCRKDINDPPQCANCSEKHPANYKGCIVYKKLAKLKLQNKRLNSHSNFNSKPSPTINVSSNDFPPYSFADTLKNNNQNQSSNFAKIEELLNKQIELTNTLLNMMSLLISKLCN